MVPHLIDRLSSECQVVSLDAQHICQLSDKALGFVFDVIANIHYILGRFAQRLGSTRGQVLANFFHTGTLTIDEVNRLAGSVLHCPNILCAVVFMSYQRVALRIMRVVSGCYFNFRLLHSFRSGLDHLVQIRIRTFAQLAKQNHIMAADLGDLDFSLEFCSNCYVTGGQQVGKHGAIGVQHSAQSLGVQSGHDVKSFGWFGLHFLLADESIMLHICSNARTFSTLLSKFCGFALLCV